MTGPDEATPEFKDRTLGLIVFGVVSILIGACSALLVPLMFLSVAHTEAAGGGGVDLRSAWAASAMYGFLAVVFVWLGIGSIRARRWACELLLSLSWIWLLTGICSLILGILVIPAVVGQAGAASEKRFQSFNPEPSYLQVRFGGFVREGLPLGIEVGGPLPQEDLQICLQGSGIPGGGGHRQEEQVLGGFVNGCQDPGSRGPHAPAQGQGLSGLREVT